MNSSFNTFWARIGRKFEMFRKTAPFFSMNVWTRAWLHTGLYLNRKSCKNVFRLDIFWWLVILINFFQNILSPFYFPPWRGLFLNERLTYFYSILSLVSNWKSWKILIMMTRHFDKFFHLEFRVSRSLEHFVSFWFPTMTRPFFSMNVWPRAWCYFCAPPQFTMDSFCYVATCSHSRHSPWSDLPYL